MTDATESADLDLIAQLREDIGDGAVVLLVGDGHRYDPLRLKAADEIERLRDENEALRHSILHPVAVVVHADETTPSLNCPTCGLLYSGRGGQRGLPVMLSCPNRHQWPDPRGGCND